MLYWLLSYLCWPLAPGLTTLLTAQAVMIAAVTPAIRIIKQMQENIYRRICYARC